MIEVLRNALEILETVLDRECSRDLREAAEKNLIISMRNYMESKGYNEEMKDIKNLVVIENGKLQEGLDNHFKSNQSKVEFTVKKAMIAGDEITLEIVTKKKWQRST